MENFEQDFPLPAERTEHHLLTALLGSFVQQQSLLQHSSLRQDRIIEQGLAARVPSTLGVLPAFVRLTTSQPTLHENLSLYWLQLRLHESPFWTLPVNWKLP